MRLVLAILIEILIILLIYENLINFNDLLKMNEISLMTIELKMDATFN
jgi:hypothetical protein